MLTSSSESLIHATVGAFQNCVILYNIQLSLVEVDQLYVHCWAPHIKLSRIFTGATLGQSRSHL